jgi:hypothetical protein
MAASPSRAWTDVVTEPRLLSGRLAGMDDLHTRRRLGALTLTLISALVLAACSAGGASAPSDAPSASPSVAPVAPEPSAGSGDGGGGTVAPDGAKIIVPKPGQAIDVQAIPAETLTATLDGRRLTVAATWWSGVEPCSILDSVVVDAEDGGFAITLFEGRGPGDVACIAIAEQHRTFIEFPADLVPGTYTIRDATGGAPSIEVVVS